VGARLLDVVGPRRQSNPIEAFSLLEVRVLGFGEARHAGIMPSMPIAVRAARADD
jgi:hypothetical protein